MCKNFLGKLLVDRLKRVLDGVIDNRQNAFPGGRQLFHRASVENEVVREDKEKEMSYF